MYTALSPFPLHQEQQEEIMKKTLFVTFMTFVLSVAIAGVVVMTEQTSGVISPIPSVSSFIGHTNAAQK